MLIPYNHSCELLSIILYLCPLKQLNSLNKQESVGCELLSIILYLCPLKQHDTCKTKIYSKLNIVLEKKNPALKVGIFLFFNLFFNSK